MTDAHIHIERGPYAPLWIDRFAEQAVRMGLEEIWLLEHSHRFAEFAPLYREVCDHSPYQAGWYAARSGLPLEDYLSLIRSMRERAFPVRIRWGLEVCYIPGHEALIREVAGTFPFDFLTGSVHWVDGFGFDHRAELWEGRDVDDLYRKYYRQMIRLAASGLFTGLAHPDSIKCFGHVPGFDLSPLYRELACALREGGMYAEQSGGLALNYGYPEAGMNPLLLGIMKEEGGSICLASDAHRPEDVGANLREMASSL